MIFTGARFAQDRLTVPESALSLERVELDMVVDVEVNVVRPAVAPMVGDGKW